MHHEATKIHEAHEETIAGFGFLRDLHVLRVFVKSRV